MEEIERAARAENIIMLLNLIYIVAALGGGAVGWAQSAPGSAANADKTAPEGPPAIEVPARTDSGQSLVIDESLLDQGDAYHVVTGEDGQIVVTSDAPLRKMVATCNRVVGYVVVPYEFEAGQKMFLGGAFRAPVASLTTGSSEQDDVLRSPMLLNSAAHAEATFMITDVTPAQAAGQDGEFTSYTFNVRGQLTARGQTKELDLPVQATHIPQNFRRTFSRYPGDFVSLRTQFDLQLADFGWKRGRFPSKDLLADSVRVDVCLFLNSIPPEKSLDPSISTADRARELKLMTLLRDFRDAAAGYAYAREQIKAAGQNAALLNRIAWTIAAEPGLVKRDLAVALEAANRAVELTGRKDAAFLDTLARVLYERGDLRAAVEAQREAVAKLAGSDPQLAGGIRASLERYESEAKAAGIEIAAAEEAKAEPAAGSASGSTGG